MEPEIENGEAVVRLTQFEVGLLLDCVMKSREGDPDRVGLTEPLRAKLLAFYPWPE